MDFPDALTICPYHPSLPASLLDYIFYLSNAVVVGKYILLPTPISFIFVPNFIPSRLQTGHIFLEQSL